jgi:molybdenum storage protein
MGKGKFVRGDGRTHLKSGLMRESLVSKKLIADTGAAEQVRSMVPNVKVLAVGGQSIMDRGAEAVLPLVDTIVQLNEAGHRMIVGVGGGARARHTLAIGTDLGLPIGGLARIVGGVEEQNRSLLQFLLGPHGGVTLIKEHLQDLQLFLSGGMIPITIGQPPYHFWEPPPREGRLPDNGPDVGLFMQAEIIGAERVVYIKDVDGIFTDDPLKHADAEFIPRASAKELLEMDLPDLPIERELLRTLENAQAVTSFRVVNGLHPERIIAAVNGEDVGTLVYSSRRPPTGMEA